MRRRARPCSATGRGWTGAGLAQAVAGRGGARSASLRSRIQRCAMSAARSAQRPCGAYADARRRVAARRAEIRRTQRLGVPLEPSADRGDQARDGQEDGDGERVAGRGQRPQAGEALARREVFEVLLDEERRPDDEQEARPQAPHLGEVPGLVLVPVAPGRPRTRRRRRRMPWTAAPAPAANASRVRTTKTGQYPCAVAASASSRPEPSPYCAAKIASCATSEPRAASARKRRRSRAGRVARRWPVTRGKIRMRTHGAHGRGTRGGPAAMATLEPAAGTRDPPGSRCARSDGAATGPERSVPVSPSGSGGRRGPRTPRPSPRGG